MSIIERNARKKTLLKIIIIAAAVIACLVGAFYFFGNKMMSDIQAAYEEIGPLDLEQTPDGVYRGTAGEFIVSVEVEVTVADHHITSIEIINQTSGEKYKALDIIPRIIESQSASVDAVSGATSSSKTIMAAVYDAINGR